MNLVFPYRRRKRNEMLCSEWLFMREKKVKRERKKKIFVRVETAHVGRAFF